MQAPLGKKNVIDNQRYMITLNNAPTFQLPSHRCNDIVSLTLTEEIYTGHYIDMIK